MSAMWAMVKHTALCAHIACSFPGKPSLEACAVHGTEFLRVISVGSYCTKSLDLFLL